jgi:hypothetical protein
MSRVTGALSNLQTVTQASKMPKNCGKGEKSVHHEKRGMIARVWKPFQSEKSITQHYNAGEVSPANISNLFYYKSHKVCGVSQT